MTKDIKGAKWYGVLNKSEPVCVPAPSSRYDPNSPAVLKGEYGEMIGDDVLLKNGYQFLRPPENEGRPHKIDRYVGGTFGFVEFKTKEPFFYQNALRTGFNQPNYEIYMREYNETNIPVTVLFVDCQIKWIYGGDLKWLDENCDPVITSNNIRVYTQFPMIKYWPIDSQIYGVLIEKVLANTNKNTGEYNTADFQVK